MIKVTIIDGKEIEYDDSDFAVLPIPEWYRCDSSTAYLHYIGRGRNPIKNPRGNTSCYRMFADFSESYLNLSEFDTSGITNMHGMFKCCYNLSCIEIGDNFKKSHSVKYMGDMFRDCHLMDNDSFSNILKNLDTTNVIDMHGMFMYCSSVNHIDITHFNTSKVKDMSYMFYGCKNLRTINFSEYDESLKFDVKNAINMSHMFAKCNFLNELNINSFKNLSNNNIVTNIFLDDYELSAINLHLKNNNTAIISEFNKNCLNNIPEYLPGYITIKHE